MQLYDCYHTLISKPENWFYSGLKDFSITELDDPQKCSKLLKRLLQNRKKDDFILYKDFFRKSNKLFESRSQHILSCYCLGKIFYDNSSSIKQAIDDFISAHNLNSQRDVNAFRYLWMLICLFHDLGYAYESKEATNSFDVEELLNKLPDTAKGIPDLYTKKLLLDYYKYRKCKFGVKDHGLTGGALLFKDLNEHFRDSSDEVWRSNIHSCVSWVIACHNIFYSYRGNKCYECNSLSDLCSTPNPRNIRLSEHPLLFLFCLVDSIEPLKTFGGVGELKSVNVEFSPESLTISVDMRCNGKKLDYLRKIQSLNDWLTDVEDLSIKL